MRFSVITLSALAKVLDRQPASAARENSRGLPPMVHPMPSEQPAARPFDLTELPPVTATRWTASHKAALVAAVRQGVLTREDVYCRYQLSAEEFTSWQRLAERHGALGLRTTRIQEYRRPNGRSEGANHEENNKPRPTCSGNSRPGGEAIKEFYRCPPSSSSN